MRRQVLPRVAGSHASKTLRGAQRDDDDQHVNTDEGAELGPKQRRMMLMSLCVELVMLPQC